MYRFSLSSEPGFVSYLSSDDLVASGYSISDKSDCSVKISYNSYSNFVTCGSFPSSPSFSSIASVSSVPDINSPVSIGSRSYDNVVLADKFQGTQY